MSKNTLHLVGVILDFAPVFSEFSIVIDAFWKTQNLNFFRLHNFKQILKLNCKYLCIFKRLQLKESYFQTWMYEYGVW